MFSNKFFNVRLYLEGLKRLKVIGMASAILCITVSALIPIVYWLDPGTHTTNISIISINALCFPLYGMILLAPFFFSTLFSFLNKRKESDFFHAIPYTRTCVYLSFTAAALSFVFAIMLLSSLTAGLIWALNPLTTFKLGELASVTLMCMLAAAELSAVMMLAITLTGTETTQGLMFLLFTFLVRLLLLYVSIGFESHVDILLGSDIPFLQFSWFLPFGMLAFAVTGGQDGSFNPLASPENILYSLGVTVLLFVAAWFFYKTRKSEMAGNTAPNQVTQHVFRILFTLPFALLLPLFIFADGMDATGFLVFLVITLLVYYLYELITTKRFKGFGKATLLLPVVLFCCLLFFGILGAVEKGIYATTPTSSEDVASVHIDIHGAGWDDYQSYLMEDAVSADPALIDDIMEALAQTVECDRADNYRLHYGKWGQSDASPVDIRWLRVQLNMKNGATVVRRIAFREHVYNAVRNEYVLHASVDNAAFLSLPSRDLLYHYNPEYYSMENGFFHNFKNFDDLPMLYEILSREYARLSPEDQLWIRTTYAQDVKLEEGGPGIFSLYLLGHIPNTQYTVRIHLCVTQELMPETFAYLESRKILE